MTLRSLVELAIVVDPSFDQNCYVLHRRDTDAAVVIDPGLQHPQVLELLERHGLRCERILLTHGHGDHGGQGHGGGHGHGHSHGTVDATIFTSERGLWATRWSFIALFVTASAQLVVVGDHRQMPRRAEGAPPAGAAGAHPLRGQPVQRARAVKRKRIGRRVSTEALRQPLEPTSDTNERVVRLHAGTCVGDAQFGRAHHHVLNRTGARQQRDLTSHAVDAWCFHAQRIADGADRLPAAHADMDPHPNRAEVRKLAGGMRRQAFEAALLKERG